MIVLMKGLVVQTVKHASWYEVTVHVPVYDGIDLNFCDTVDFDTTFQDKDVKTVLKLMERGSKR